MKLICDCGNEEEFNTIDKETGQPNRITEDEGQYATIENFDLWQMDYEIGIKCSKCGKAIWMFT
jgi:hypothetical protein